MQSAWPFRYIVSQNFWGPVLSSTVWRFAPSFSTRPGGNGGFRETSSGVLDEPSLFTSSLGGNQEDVTNGWRSAPLTFGTDAPDAS